MEDITAVERVLGFEHSERSSVLLMAERIQRGFPVNTLMHLQRAVAPGDKGFVHRIVARPTLQRRRKMRQPLNPHDSEKAHRVARAWTAAVRVYQDYETARAFLERKHPLFDDQAPMAVAMQNSAGLEAVEDLLGRLEHGSAL